IAGTLEFTSLGMVLGIFVRDPETGAAIANAIGFPMMFLAGSFFPVDAMPSFLQTGARLLPLTYINEGLRATMTFGSEATALVDLHAPAFLVFHERGLREVPTFVALREDLPQDHPGEHAVPDATARDRVDHPSRVADEGDAVAHGLLDRRGRRHAARDHIEGLCVRHPRILCDPAIQVA